MPRPGLCARRHFGKYQPPIEHRFLPSPILRRVEIVDTTRDHADGAGFQRSVMSRSIDAARKTGHDAQTFNPEIVGEHSCKATSGGRRVARADKGDCLPVEQIQPSFRDDQRRSIVQLRQQTRIKPLPQHEMAGTDCLDFGNLPLRVIAAKQPRRSAAAAARELGNRLQSGGRRPEAADQLAESDRADARRAKQPYAVDEVVSHLYPSQCEARFRP